MADDLVGYLRREAQKLRNVANFAAAAGAPDLYRAEMAGQLFAAADELARYRAIPGIADVLEGTAVVVPRLPTREMIGAWIRATPWISGREEEQYIAMLAASPYAKEKTDG